MYETEFLTKIVVTLLEDERGRCERSVVTFETQLRGLKSPDPLDKCREGFRVLDNGSVYETVLLFFTGW